jgi:acetyl esterase/lipase
MDSYTDVGAAMPQTIRRYMAAAPVRFALALVSVALLALATSVGASASTRLADAELPPALEYLQYGPGSQQVASVYPSAKAGSPLVILVHGGGWRKQGALGRLELEALSLQREDFTVVEVNYDQISPAFPLESNDIAAATRWAIANAAAFNADPANVTLLGGSAGGQLVAVAAEQLDAAYPGTVDAVVTLSGPTDFVSLIPMLGSDTLDNESFDKSVHLALGWPMLTSFAASTHSYAETWSPALHTPKSNCPHWLIFNSEAEFIPLVQAKEMYSNLTAAGCQATLNVVPGTEHAFAYFHRVKPQIFSFIRGQ